MKVSLNSLDRTLGSDLDLFICSSSFEERCLAVPESLGLSVKKVLVCENQDYEPFVSHNTQRLLKHFGRRAKKVTLRTDDPLLVADNLSGALEKAIRPQTETCVVDISTFTHESLLILVKVLNQSGYKGSLRFVYAGAKDYALNLPDNEKWLTKGVDDVRSVLGYPGIILPSQRLHLVVMVGFESERAEKLIETYEPAAISLGLGTVTESVRRDHHKVNAGFHQKVLEFARNLATQKTDTREFSFSCVDPIRTRSSLLEQLTLYPDYNTVIAPMNTKVSTLGAALVALENAHVQLCYAHAVHYKIDGYSAPDNDCRILDGGPFLTVYKG